MSSWHLGNVLSSTSSTMTDITTHGTWCAWWRPPQRLLLRAICILLECILVAPCFWYIVFLHHVLHVLVQQVFLTMFWTFLVLRVFAPSFWNGVFWTMFWMYLVQHIFASCFWFGRLYFCFMFCYSMLLPHILMYSNFCTMSWTFLVHCQWRIQDFPRGGAPTPKVDTWTYFFGRKLHENERILAPRGGRASLAPPP